MNGMGSETLDRRVPELLRPDLPAVVAAALGRDSVEVIHAGGESIIPPGANMTTGGLWRITGSATDATAPNGPGRQVPQRFSIIAKLIQSPLLWPGISVVPEEFRQQLADRYPWRTEAQAYASGVGDVLPSRARMPRLYRITNLDGQRKLIWMEDAAGTLVPGWTDQDFAAAAYVLGGLAGSQAVDRCVDATADATDASRLRFFLEGVGSQLLIPAIQGEDVWRHPSVAAVADPAVVHGLRSIARRSWKLMEGLSVLPQLPVHGDASPQNMLLEDSDGGRGAGTFVLIDWGGFGRGPVGFDLAQLLAGRVNSGDLAGSELHRLAPTCIDAYCEGMADAGTPPNPVEVSRGQAAAMAIFSGLFALPLDQLDAPTPGLENLVASRLDMVRFILKRLEQSDC